jgi:hypothetical protein
MTRVFFHTNLELFMFAFQWYRARSHLNVAFSVQHTSHHYD